METVSNVVNSASKMIWGDSAAKNETAGQEPVSGETGEGTADKPYDKGNETGLPTTTAESTKGVADIATPSAETSTSATKQPAATPGEEPVSTGKPLTPEHPAHPDAGNKVHADFSPVTKPIPGPDRTTSHDGISKPTGTDTAEPAATETDTSLAGAEKRAKEGQQLTDAKREDLISKDQRGASATEAIPATAKPATSTSPSSAPAPPAASTPSPAASAKASSTASPKSDKKPSKIDKLMDKLHIHKKHGEGGEGKSA